MIMDTTGLERNAANHAPLTPLVFIRRAAEVHGDRTAIVYGNVRRNWRETWARVRRLASALRRRGIKPGDTVAALLPNTPEMVELHFAVPLAGAVLNALNTRLDANSIRYMLEHAEARVLLVDREFAALADEAIRGCGQSLLVVDVADASFGGEPAASATVDYETLLADGDERFDGVPIADEWDAICLNYTSGTTGRPKGVVYHHRGAYLNAVSNILEWDLPRHPVYLWTLPLFHCNGWCFPWTIAARAGVNVCMRRVDAEKALALIAEQRVTHYCGAPIVHKLLATAPASLREQIRHRVHAMVAGAAPPAALLAEMSRMGFELRHVYGLTEVYGPAAVCEPQPEWEGLDPGELASLNARQGVRYHLQDAVDVVDPETMAPVPSDGQTIGEVVFRGNIVMKGYLKNPAATAEAFAGGWFRTGDLAVKHPDGYLKVKDRSKDIIISGGENISSIEIEDVLSLHPAVMMAAVVACPDAHWGETPGAFVELLPGASVSAEELRDHCRRHLAGFKLPRRFEFGELPKTSTGKVQKTVLREKIKAVHAIDV
jgi:fatty-acyl-CoA synthase